LARSVIYDLENWSPKTVRQLQISYTGVRSASYRAGFPDGLGPVFEELLKYSPLFDNAFLLTANVEARKERLAQRGEQATNHDRLIITEPERVARMDASMLQQAGRMMGATIIDTSQMNQDEVAALVKDMINGLKPKEQLTGVRISQKDIGVDKAYFEKELDNYFDFIIRKKKLNI
jgi:hypothetical protein